MEVWASEMWNQNCFDGVLGLRKSEIGIHQPNKTRLCVQNEHKVSLEAN